MTYKHNQIESIKSQITQTGCDIELLDYVKTKTEFNPRISYVYMIFKTQKHGNVKVYDKKYLSYLRFGVDSEDGEPYIQKSNKWPENYGLSLGVFGNDEYRKYQTEKIVKDFLGNKSTNKYSFLPNVLCVTDDYIIVSHPTSDKGWVEVKDVVQLFKCREPSNVDKFKMQFGLKKGPSLFEHTLWKEILDDLHQLWTDTKTIDDNYKFGKLVGLDCLEPPEQNIPEHIHADDFYVNVIHGVDGIAIDTRTNYINQYICKEQSDHVGVTLTDWMEVEWDDCFYYNEETDKWMLTGLEFLAFENKTRNYFSQQQGISVDDVSERLQKRVSDDSVVEYYTPNVRLHSHKSS